MRVHWQGIEGYSSSMGRCTTLKALKIKGKRALGKDYWLWP